MITFPASKFAGAIILPKHAEAYQGQVKKMTEAEEEENRHQGFHNTEVSTGVCVTVKDAEKITSFQIVQSCMHLDSQ